MNLKQTKQLIVTLILIVYSINYLHAAVITVAKTGGDYITIQAGVNAAIAGDTVVVKAGTYKEMVTITKSGTASQRITIRGESGAIIDGTGVTLPTTGDPCGLVFIDSKSYITIKGFEIKNAVMNSTDVFQAGIFVIGTGTGVHLLNNKVSNIVNSLEDSGCHGIAVYGTSNTSMKDVLVDGNEVFNCQLGWSESLVLNGNIDGFTISNNIIHDNNNIGIDIIGHEGTCPTASLDQVRNGTCTDNRVYNITSKGNAAYGNEESAGGIYVDGGLNIIIERNIIDKCDIGIEIASEWKNKNTEGITVRNNFLSRSVQGNLQTGGYDSNRGNAVNCVFANNTTYQGAGGEMVLQYNCSGITITNNIFVRTSTGDGYIQQWGSNNTGVIVSNNIYYGGSTSSPGDFADALAKYVNPQLTSTYTNMHILNTSPAVDAGVTYAAGTYDIDLQARIYGTKVDIGADEYIPAGVAPTLTDPANKTQTVTSGTAINSIVFTWGGGATDVTVTGLPAGVTATKNSGAKTLTISGSPTATATYTVTTVGGTGAVSVSGAITATPAVSCITLLKIQISAIPTTGTYRLVLYDSSGTTELKTLANGLFNTGNTDFLFSPSGLSAGNYTYKLLSGVTVVKTGTVVIP